MLSEMKKIYKVLEITGLTRESHALTIYVQRLQDLNIPSRLS